MNEKLDAVLDKIGGLFDKWLAEFEANPLKTTIKVCLILVVIKWAKRSLKG